MLVFELIKNKLINIRKAIKPIYAGKTPSLLSYYIKLGFSKLLINLIAIHSNYIFKIVTFVNLSYN